MKKRIKVVIDTNLFVSQLMNKSKYMFVDLLVGGEIEIQSCDDQIAELEDVLNRKKFEKYFTKQDIVNFLDFFRSEVFFHDLDKIKAISRDPKDDYLLALCKKSKADYLITGDKDLLVIGQYGKTEIITYGQFVNQ